MVALGMNANFLVAQNLRRRRIMGGLSQEALAHEADVDRTYVSRIERGMENCTVAVLEKFARAIGCDIRDFFDPDVEGQPQPKPLKVGRKPK
jgi:transcriptional regulator with XRE-family HTH domain